jgi:CRP-like cAMP-binding protein
MDFTAEERNALRNALKRVFFLEHLKMAELDALINGMEKLPFRKGDRLIRQGEPGEAFYIISSGSLGVYKRMLGLLRFRIATRRRGDFVGEMALIDRAPRNATIIADGDGEAFFISRSTFDQVLLGNPSIAEMIRKVAEGRRAQDRAAGF